MSDIEWVDEPPFGKGNWNRLRREEARKFADELKRNPGKWAVYPWASTSEAARATASRISNGRTATFAHGFQAISKGEVVYVCYQEE